MVDENRLELESQVRRSWVGKFCPTESSGYEEKKNRSDFEILERSMARFNSGEM